MKIYIVSSDKYNYLLNYHHIFLNKYWKDQDVTVLCHEMPNVNLPKNYSIKSIGKQKRDLSTLFNYFSSCNDDYFVLMLEDQFLVDYVDVNKVKKLENEIRLGNADKACLHFYNNGETFDIGNGLVEIHQNVHYRTSVQPSIWTRKYLMRHLNPNCTWWSFETQHEKTKNDGAKIILLKDQITGKPIIEHINVYMGGVLERKCFIVQPDRTKNGLVHEEDVAIINGFLK